jgi:hypothetical protein
MNLLANNAVRGCALKEILRNVGADNADLPCAFAFIVIPGSTRINCYGIDVKHGGGSHASDYYVVRLLVQVFDNFRSTRGDPGLVAGRARAENNFGVFSRYIFALAERDEVFARGDHPRLL